MKARIGSRYTSEGRTDLSKAIPLNTPLLLFVDPSSACNFKCIFCPCGGGNKEQWASHKRTGIMSYEIYRKIINDACHFPGRIKTLRLYKEGEPLLNRRITDMIWYARKKQVADHIDFTTNASVLTADLSLALVDSGIDRLNISIEALSSEDYRKNAGVEIDFNKLLRNLKYLYDHRQRCHIFLKVSDFGLKGHNEQEFYDLFGDMCDEISVEHVTPVWPGFDLSHVQKEFSEGIYGNEIREIEVCPYIFYSICVNSDGTVSSCFMDWNHELIIGDAKSDSIVDIWNSKKMQDMRIQNLEGGRKDLPVCANCGQLPYAALDNLDAGRDILREKLSTCEDENIQTLSRQGFRKETM